MLGDRGWRFMGDEFALLEPASGRLHPFPRPVSLKNEAIGVMAREVGAERFGPAMEGTPKGRIQHLRPNREAIAGMREPARPALILFPRFGKARDLRPVGPAEAFMRLTQASTNYVAMGEQGYEAVGGDRAVSGALLVQALRDPGSLGAGCDWTGLISAARAEQLIGTLAFRLQGSAVPERVERLLAMHRADAERVRVQALWEAEMARRALAPLGVPVVLLKGTAFLAAGLDAAQGRSIGDLDILVPRGSLDAVEQALIGAGWEPMKEGYDDLYYRTWMHELPPLIHRERDRMIDVHHNILPLTARPKPDAEALVTQSTELPEGLWVLSPEDMIVHAAAHLLADGDMAGGLRNLWDIDRLLRQFERENGFWDRLADRAEHHQLRAPVRRAVRLASSLYGTPVPPAWAGRSGSDVWFKRRLLARDGWGRQTRPAIRFGAYVRGHCMRMPPLMLARHLIRKARS
jgi:hypothetical protein